MITRNSNIIFSSNNKTYYHHHDYHHYLHIHFYFNNLMEHEYHATTTITTSTSTSIISLIVSIHVVGICYPRWDVCRMCLSNTSTHVSWFISLFLPFNYYHHAMVFNLYVLWIALIWTYSWMHGHMCLHICLFENGFWALSTYNRLDDSFANP